MSAAAVVLLAGLMMLTTLLESANEMVTGRAFSEADQLVKLDIPQFEILEVAIVDTQRLNDDALEPQA